MPYGRSGSSVSQIAPVQSGPVPNGANGRNSASQQSTDQVTPWLLLGLVVAYFAWGLLERHKLQDQVQPRNVGINLRNIAVIMLQVLIGVNLLKIAAAKYQAWGMPGGSWLVKFVGNV